MLKYEFSVVQHAKKHKIHGYECLLILANTTAQK